MRLYLVQHGNAVAEELNPDRPLSERGVAEVERMAAFLARLELPAPEIWHSGKTRARQTAERLSYRLTGRVDVKAKEGLKPRDPAERSAEALRESGLSHVMLVGHMPHLAHLASLLLTGDAKHTPVRFQQGGILALEEEGGGEWQLLWMLAPELLP